MILEQEAGKGFPDREGRENKLLEYNLWLHLVIRIVRRRDLVAILVLRPKFDVPRRKSSQNT